LANVRKITPHHNSAEPCTVMGHTHQNGAVIGAWPFYFRPTPPYTRSCRTFI